MLYNTPELSAQEVLRHTQALREEHLPLNAEGYKCTTDDLFKVLVGVAATKGHRHEGLSRQFYCEFDEVVWGLDTLAEALG